MTDVAASPLAVRAARAGAAAFLRNPLALAGTVLVLVLVVLAALAPLIGPYDPFAQDLAGRLLPPSAAHVFGTDELGRDIATRIMFGARITLRIVVLIAVIVAPVGLLVGTAAGYFGGIVESALMRVTDVFLAFPKLILALALVSAIGPSLENAIVAIAATSWPAYARVARAETVALRNADFIAAARLLGASHARILLRHIAPLCVSSVVVRLTLDMAGVVLTAAGLGFLGLGAQPPTPEWGAMMAAGREYLTDQWWVAAFPGFAILLVSLGFNLVGDGLRDVLDPKEPK
jgi:peptide/nickel transport system permease protein